MYVYIQAPVLMSLYTRPPRECVCAYVCVRVWVCVCVHQPSPFTVPSVPLSAYIHGKEWGGNGRVPPPPDSPTPPAHQPLDHNYPPTYTGATGSVSENSIAYPRAPPTTILRRRHTAIMQDSRKSILLYYNILLPILLLSSLSLFYTLD